MNVYALTDWQKNIADAKVNQATQTALDDPFAHKRRKRKAGVPSPKKIAPAKTKAIFTETE